MKKKSILSPQTLTLALILVVIFYLWTQHQKIKRPEEFAGQQARANWDLQLASFQASRARNQQIELVNELVRRNPPKDAETVLIIKDLNELAKIFTPNLPQMAMEMESAGKLLGADQFLNSAATLAKIMENIFKDFFLKDEAFQKRHKKKTVNLGNLISYIEEKAMCSTEEITFLKELKGLRNDVAHQLDVRKPKAYLVSFHRKCIDFIKCNISRFSMVV